MAAARVYISMSDEIEILPLFLPFPTKALYYPAKQDECPLLLHVQQCILYLSWQNALCCAPEGWNSVLVIILSSDFIDFLEIVLLFCADFGDLGLGNEELAAV
jgi:hypothetical protein